MSAKQIIRHRRNPVATAVGKRVKECRIDAGKSQEELAHEAHLDRTRIGAIERGDANPTVETLAQIAFVLGLTLSELFQPVHLSLAPTGEIRSHAKLDEPKRRRLR
ncbi:helix-turn-helix domain-containing protein [Paraburkholderia hospita]|uniref:helix-turn-helix transcriptional regulator n=1 Tax=Paraburkholderia hospita TaxID=169430 RepID=UPI003ED0A7BB